MQRKRFALILVLALLCLGGAFAEAKGPEDYLGGPMPDFTVSTLDGGTFTLSDALKEKDAVLVNFWATWCGPCAFEFPYLEEAYEQYADRVAVIALSTDPEDTDDMLQAYAEEHGLTFPVASDTQAGLADLFVDQGIPTSVLVDRFGNVAMIDVGAQTSAAPFVAAFDMLSSDDYSETIVLNGFPRPKPNVESPSAEELCAAAGLSADGPVTLAPSEDAAAWPFVPDEVDGVACLSAANAGCDDTTAELRALVSAREGDALAFRVRTSTELLYDRMVVYVNGEEHRIFSGEREWMDWAVALAPGDNQIDLCYEKDYADGSGADTVSLADFRLLTGGEAQETLAALPAYPYAPETRLDVLDEGAREIEFAPGALGGIQDYFGVEDVRCYIVGGDTAQMQAALSDACNADDTAFFASDPESGGPWSSEDILQGPFTVAIDSAETTGYSHTAVFGARAAGTEIFMLRVLVADEANADLLEQQLMAEGYTEGYAYADGGARGGSAQAIVPDAGTIEAVEEPGKATWTVRFLDQDGAPVPGCVINFCSDVACTPTVADEDGIATFTGAPYPYHLQVLMVPEGYAFDTAQEFTAEETGGEITIPVEKQ